MMQSLPPTQDALHMLVNRSVYQANVRLKCLQPTQNLPTLFSVGKELTDFGNQYGPIYPKQQGAAESLLNADARLSPFATKNAHVKTPTFLYFTLSLQR